MIGVLIAAFGRTTAFNIASSMWLVSGVLVGGVAWTMTADEEHVRDKVAHLRVRGAALGG